MNGRSALETLNNYFNPLGLEVHTFKVGWYNETVDPAFRLQHARDALCFVVISAPSMFEKALVPFVKAKHREDGVSFKRDPLDECLKACFEGAAELFPDQEVTIIQDFELHPNRRPKVLVQTAAHVAGCAYYYQRSSVDEVHTPECPRNETVVHTTAPDCLKKLQCACESPWDKTKRIYGVCVHPDYGGWFAIRGVMIFPHLRDESIERPEPPDCIRSRSQRIELLNRFNNDWRDWTYRDMIPVKEKYSELQKKYFATLPKDRHSLLEEIAIAKSAPTAAE